MRWPGIEELYGPSLRSTRVFGANGTQQLDAGDISDQNESAKDAKGDKRWEELHLRVVEHVCFFSSVELGLYLRLFPTEHPNDSKILHPHSAFETRRTARSASSTNRGDLVPLSSGKDGVR